MPWQLIKKKNDERAAKSSGLKSMICTVRFRRVSWKHKLHTWNSIHDVPLFRFLIQIQFGVHLARPGCFLCMELSSRCTAYRWLYKRPGVSSESWFWSVYVYKRDTIYNLKHSTYTVCIYLCSYRVDSRANWGRIWFLRFHEVWQGVLLSSSWLAFESVSLGLKSAQLNTLTVDPSQCEILMLRLTVIIWISAALRSVHSFRADSQDLGQMLNFCSLLNIVSVVKDQE